MILYCTYHTVICAQIHPCCKNTSFICNGSKLYSATSITVPSHSYIWSVHLKSDSPLYSSQHQSSCSIWVSFIFWMSPSSSSWNCEESLKRGWVGRSIVSKVVLVFLNCLRKGNFRTFCFVAAGSTWQRGGQAAQRQRAWSLTPAQNKGWPGRGIVLRTALCNILNLCQGQGCYRIPHYPPRPSLLGGQGTLQGLKEKVTQCLSKPGSSGCSSGAGGSPIVEASISLGAAPLNFSKSISVGGISLKGTMPFAISHRVTARL